MLIKKLSDETIYLILLWGIGFSIGLLLANFII